jgi:hypothetical protein
VGEIITQAIYDEFSFRAPLLCPRFAPVFHGTSLGPVASGCHGWLRMRQDSSISMVGLKVSSLRAMILCLLILMTALGLGQTNPPTGTAISEVAVIVTDPSGARVTDAEVTFKGEITATKRTADDGSVHFELPYGRYEVTVVSRGFKTARIVGFAVELPKLPVLNVALKIGDYSSLISDPVVISGIPVTTSDLPNVIEENPSVANLPMGSGGYTLYPPFVYIQLFTGCPTGKPCRRKDRFRVNPIPKGCCVLDVTNGDGRGGSEVRSYEIFLNGKRVLPVGPEHGRSKVKIRQQNSLEVVLVGEPSSKVAIQIAYDLRQSK